MQQLLFDEAVSRDVRPFKEQLLKWIGNKQRFAHEIASFFPENNGTYYEPFLGSGAVLATLAPKAAVGSDCFLPLIQIWETLHRDPGEVKEWYSSRYARMAKGDKVLVYEEIKASYNRSPNPADLLFISRACYGGVVRFRKSDGYCSTPCGAHSPMPPKKFAARVDLWHARTRGVQFKHADYRDMMRQASSGDIVYCDPPYSHSQAILYGAQSFSLKDLFEEIASCKARGAKVALSIDGTKKTGTHVCDLPIPDGLFEREILVNCGRSMLRRFQRPGETLEDEVVHDRLLLTY